MTFEESFERVLAENRVFAKFLREWPRTKIPAAPGSGVIDDIDRTVQRVMADRMPAGKATSK